MFVNTFIRRPVLTTVCTFLILLLGSISIPNLPISQIPDLAPVQITVSANFLQDWRTTIIPTVAIPVSLIGTCAALLVLGFQINTLTLFGFVLAAKNAILVVEFANHLHEQGMSYTRAAVKAGEERLRPILMTAFAALLGFLPLVTSSGAGASSRWSLGTALFGGLLLATFLSLFLVPILYILIKSLAQAIFSRQRPGGSNPKKPPNSPNGAMLAGSSSQPESKRKAAMLKAAMLKV